MHIDVVTISIQTVVEHQRCVHKRTWIHQTATLTNLHLFNVKDKTAVENVECHRAFATKKKDLVVSDLVSQPHVGGHPLGLVDLGGRDFLPNIARNVINFNSIHDSLLIDSSPESKDVVVLEDAERGASARHAHISDQFPLVFLGVVNFAVAVHLVAHEGADHVDEVLDGADGVVGVRVVHVSHLVQDSKKIIVPIAVLQIHPHMLNITACQVNCPRFRCN